MKIRICIHFTRDYDSTFVKAETGANHFDMTKKLIDVPASANVDVVKFQTYNACNSVFREVLN